MLKLVPPSIRCEVCGEPIARGDVHAHDWFARLRATLALRRRERQARIDERRRGTENVLGRLTRHLGGEQ